MRREELMEERESLLWYRGYNKAKKELQMKKNKNLVVINETHSLLPQQVLLLDAKFGVGNWERLDLPASGMKLDEMQSMINSLHTDCEIIIASPVPAIIKMISTANLQWSVFHNDNRIKRELPNGKIIMTVAKTGWQII